TTIQPDPVIQVVSMTLVPGSYRRLTGASRPGGPMRQKPALRSRTEPKMLEESKRGRQSHSTEPSRATSAPVWQSARNPYDEIRGKRDCRGGMPLQPTGSE